MRLPSVRLPLRIPMAHALAALAAIGVAACSQTPPPAPPPAPTAAATKDEGPELPDLYIDRGKLEVILKQGPGWLLERVPIEEVVDGKEFVGWRVLEVPLEWRSLTQNGPDVDLRPGDVVTAVNTMPVETPSDFWAAWTTLTVASELKVTYRREGEERELSVPILGQPTPGASEELGKLQGDAPPAERRDQARPQKETVIIKDQQRPITDTLVDWSD